MENKRKILEENFASIRLDDEQRKALRNAIEWLDCDVYVFGSRTDQNKRGGDIDILVFSDERSITLANKIKNKYYEFCEEHIDIVVAAHNLSNELKLFIDSIEKKLKIL